MSVQFILGRAGTGKTHACLEAIRERLRDEPVHGPRLILLVPEQASLQMEQTLIAPPDIGVAHRAEVLSFRRLAYRVLDSVGGAGIGQAISENARAMVLRHLLTVHRHKLQYYRRGERVGGLAAQLGKTIAELIDEAVTPVDLAAENGTDTTLNHRLEIGATQAKLHDLQLIYDAYLDYLGTDRLDPSHSLQAAREFLNQCEWLKGAWLWVDGFASLSGQETLTLVALARLCGHTHISMLVDPDGIGAPQGEHDEFITGWKPVPHSITGWKPVPHIEGDSWMSQTHQTYFDLLDVLKKSGLAIDEPIVLNDAVPKRFEHSPQLASIEASIFNGKYVSHPDRVGHQCEQQHAAQVVALPNRRVEVEYAVAQIVRWVQDENRPYRYRDCAIIARDLEPYHDLLSVALLSRGIPFFLDRRRSIAHHPLVQWLRATLAVAVDPYAIEPVRLLLKTDLLPLQTQGEVEADAFDLENYLLAHGISGAKAWQGEPWRRMPRGSSEHDDVSSVEQDSVNAVRKRFMELMGTWIDEAGDGCARTGPDWTDMLTGLIESLGINRRLADWATAAEEQGDLDGAEEHRQVWRDVMAFLSDLAYAFEDVAVTVDELEQMLETGLSRLTLGLAPPMLDQVLVGSIDRSRHPDIAAAVILGFNDGVFPATLSEDSILNDDDRELLAGRGVHVGATRRRRTLDERMLAYIAVTRAAEKLLVTYALSDEDGKELRPSPYISALETACPGLQLQHVGDPVRGRKTWDILTPRDLASRLAVEFRTRKPLAMDDPTERGLFNAMYEITRVNEPLAPDSLRSGCGVSAAFAGLAARKP